MAEDGEMLEVSDWGDAPARAARAAAHGPYNSTRRLRTLGHSG